MKIALKLIVCAILSFSVGIACASPLLVSELTIKPWIEHVQGPTAEFDVNVVYANFTLLNSDVPVEKNSGPAISYFVVANVTNPSDFPARLVEINFCVAKEITKVTGSMNPFGVNGNWSSSSGWEAEGAWVDGKWYNVTWVNSTYPRFDKDGNMVQSAFDYPEEMMYWMEGVQICDRFVNGTLVATYLNMNGTWTDVTGKITVNRPPEGSSYRVTGAIVDEMHAFENVAVREYTSDGIALGSSFGVMKVTHHLVGEGLFDNNWAPHESRLIAISSSWDVRKPLADENAVEALQSSNLAFKTQTMNSVDVDTRVVNNTTLDTWSYATELKEVQLTQSGNSYIYNTILNDDQMFQADQWNVEVFVKPRS